MNGWLSSLSFHVNRPSHSWDQAISNSDLEMSRSCGMVVQSVHHLINSLPFHFTIRPTIPEIRAFSKFDLEKSKVKVMSEVQDQGHIVYPVSNPCTSLSFHINRTNHSRDMSKRVFSLEKIHPIFLKKICPNSPPQSFQQNFSKIQSGNKHN